MIKGCSQEFTKSSEIFKTFDEKEVSDLRKEKIFLFHNYALGVQKKDIFEIALIEPEKLDKKTGGMRGPINIFKPKPGKVDFSTLIDVSAINDVAQTVSKSEWWPIEEIRKVAFNKSQGIRTNNARGYCYTNHIERLKAIKAIDISNYGRD